VKKQYALMPAAPARDIGRLAVPGAATQRTTGSVIARGAAVGAWVS
jgi:hypothetical protein